MPRHLLTDAQIRNSPAGEYHDGDGLVLVVRSPTSASWHFRYSLNGRRPKAGIGSYVDGMTLKRAREIAHEMRMKVSDGVDPIGARRASARRGMSVSEAATACLEAKAGVLKGGGEAGRWMSPLTNHVMPKLGEKSVALLSIEDVVSVLEPIWIKKHPTAVKASNRLEQIMRYAASFDDRIDPTIIESARLRLGAHNHKVEHHAALPWQQAPVLYAALSASVAHIGMRFYLLTLPRTSNVTKAVWSEIDRENEVWTIPDDRMKSGIEFKAPLSQQALLILGSRKRGGRNDYVFPSDSAWRHGVISSNTWNQWFKDNKWPTTAHGLRSTFRDWIAENEICSDSLAEHCIQHETRGKVERAYHRSEKLELRRAVMQTWADYITGQTIHDLADLREEKIAVGLKSAQAEGRMLDVTLNDLIEDRD